MVASGMGRTHAESNEKYTPSHNEDVKYDDAHETAAHGHAATDMSVALCHSWGTRLLMSLQLWTCSDAF
jgi:hypothetical protein